MAEPRGNPPGPPHALRMPAKTPLAGDRPKIGAPGACAVPFRPYCGGVVTRTRNLSEYMLVLAVCLVEIQWTGSLDVGVAADTAALSGCPETAGRRQHVAPQYLERRRARRKSTGFVSGGRPIHRRHEKYWKIIQEK